MSYIDNYIQSKGGFNFDFVNRNFVLTDKMHMKQPPFTKTGTTIVGLITKDAVILAADTRATAGSIVADKNCEKLHKLSPNIYAAGAGTAAG
jgi:20S proteasome subunit beta 2